MNTCNSVALILFSFNFSVVPSYTLEELTEDVVSIALNENSPAPGCDTPVN